LCPPPSCFPRTQTPCHTFIYSVCWIVLAVGRGHRDVYVAFCGFSISTPTFNFPYCLLVVEKPVRKREQRQGVVKVNAGARLVMERASFSLGRQTPARRSTLIPSTPLRGTPRAAALRSFYIPLVNTVCVVACLRTTYLAPIPQPSTVTLVRALAMKCSLG